MFWLTKSPEMPSRESALPGRAEPVLQAGPHHVSGRPIGGPYPDGFEVAEFALGCFASGARRRGSGSCPACG